MSGVDYLYEPDGSELHWDGMKQAAKPQQAGSVPPATLVSTHPDERRGMQNTAPAQKAHIARDPIGKAPVRQVTPDDLMAQAQTMLAAHKVQSEAQLGHTSIGDRDDAGSLLPDWLKGAAGR